MKIPFNYTPQGHIIIRDEMTDKSIKTIRDYDKLTEEQIHSILSQLKGKRDMLNHIIINLEIAAHKKMIEYEYAPEDEEEMW